ncbi:uncharacterized protein ACBT44_010682 [Syngnathus typhle]
MALNEMDSEGDEGINCIDYHRNMNCNQYIPGQLKQLTNINNCSFLHLNIWSLNKHHDDLVTLLTNTGCSFDVIGCSETWLNDRSYTDILNLNGYKLLTKNRCGRPGGGVCLYISSTYNVRICDDIVIADNHSDSLFVEISGKSRKTLIIGIIYCPPDADLEIFRTKLEEALFSINDNNKSCVLLGNFNVDLSKDDTAKNDFINTLHSSSFFPTINAYTRVTHSTKSIIDNFITNFQNATLTSGTVLSEISDHFPFVLFIDLPGIYDCSDVDAAFETLTKEISDTIQRTIPEKVIICNTTTQNPWITKGILKSIKHKNKLYKIYINEPNHNNKIAYINYRNKLTHIIRKRKRNHFADLKSWRVLNKVLNRNQKTPVFPDHDDNTSNII